jgi:hypothetical protein
MPVAAAATVAATSLLAANELVVLVELLSLSGSAKDEVAVDAPEGALND